LEISSLISSSVIVLLLLLDIVVTSLVLRVFWDQKGSGGGEKGERDKEGVGEDFIAEVGLMKAEGY